jgi:putative oxidoreductase
MILPVMLRPLASALARLESPAYAALRIVAGAMFAQHGVDKLLVSLSGMPHPPVGSQMWIGGLIELVCGGLVALGLFARPAAFLASGQMAVAYFQFHWKLHMAGRAWLPVVNHGELAVLYCFVFLLIAARGAGLFSVDQLRSRT